MILAIDVGNTNIVYGLYKGAKLVASARMPTTPYVFRQFKGNISQVVVASVVPLINPKLKRDLLKAYGVSPLFVGNNNFPIVKVKLKDKKAVGADRLVNALAAITLYGGPAVVIDFGTATTFDVISGRKEYLGGAIAPGIILARDALHQRTAKLPTVEIKAPRKAIGRDTAEAMRSGLVFGYVAMVEGMVRRLKREMKAPKATVIATGGLAKLICNYTTVVDIIDMDLTLKGLRIIAEKSYRPAAERRGN